MGKRKRAALHSSRAPSQNYSHTLDISVDEELADELGMSEGGANALILPKKGAGGAAKLQQAKAEEPVVLSKSQQKKLKKLQEEKEKKSRRAEVLKDLHDHSLGRDHLQLLKASGKRGVKETRKQQLKRALQFERAGLVAAEGARLEREVRPRAEVQPDDSSSGGESEEDEASGADVMQGPPAEATMDVAGDATSEEGGVSEAEDEDAALAAKYRSAQLKLQSQSRAIKASGGGLGGRAGGDPDKEGEGAARPKKGKGEKRGGKAGREGADKAGGERNQPTPGGEPAPRPRPTAVVRVKRREEVEAARSGLPIVAMEQEIMEAIAGHPVVVLCGETGCGKTTQVPQFLYEAGYGAAAGGRVPEGREGAVAITQPRRVAVTSTAARVASELNEPLGGGKVGYQVRHDRRAREGTSLRFMTDGILLRELRSDFLLRRYSAVVIDEAHERSANTDILLGMLSRVVPLRLRMAAQGVPPLKLVIMSATLRADDFVGPGSRLFGQGAAGEGAAQPPPPVITVPSRQYPVTVHFSRRTELVDYERAAFKKVAAIHRKLPPGGVLVFLTGQREVERMCRQLREELNPPQQKGSKEDKRKGQRGRAGGGLGGGMGAETGDEIGPGADDDNDGGDGAPDPYDRDALDAGGEEAGISDGEDFFGGGGGDDDDDYDSDASSDVSSVDAGELTTEQQADEWGYRFSKALAGGGVAAHIAKHLEARLAAEKRGGEGGDGGAAAGKGGGEGARDRVHDAPAGEGGGGDAEEGPGPVHVLPLYAMLPAALQARVFRPPPPGHRLIVVATNVAETSLTIPGIRYVVDCGRAKERVHAVEAGMSRFEVQWISKASAQQRSGRAGRTGPGHSYRLFSSAHFNDSFPEFAPPEILNMPMEGVVLQLRAMGISKVANFPFPTPPERHVLSAADACLRAIGAMGPAPGGSRGGEVALTTLGRAMSAYPLSPRHARMLLEVVQERGARDWDGGPAGKGIGRKAVAAAAECVPYAVAVAAALSVESPLMRVGGGGGDSSGEAEAGGGGGAPPPMLREDKKRIRANQARLRDSRSEAITVVRALLDYERAADKDSFCSEHALHAKTMREMADLRAQLARILSLQRPGGADEAAPSLLLAAASGRGGGAGAMGWPSEPQAVLLRQAICAGWADRVAKRIKPADRTAGSTSGGEGAPRARAVRYRSCASGDTVFLHPSSPLAAEAPDFVVHTEVVDSGKRAYMAGVTAVSARWLPVLAGSMCSFSAPLEDPPPWYDREGDAVMCWREPSFGPHGWRLPLHAAPHPDPAVRCAVFAAALLDGKPVQALGSVKHMLCAPTANLLRKSGKSQARVGELLHALEQRGTCTRAALEEVWKKEPQFLKAQVAMWFRADQRGQLERAWSRVCSSSNIM